MLHHGRMELIKRGYKLVAGVLVASIIGGMILTACSNAPDENTVAKYLPENSLAFVTAALSPSVKQKANLALMSRHLPESARATKANQAKDKLLQNFFQSQHLDYNSDIKPWLGSEAAIAALPPLSGEQAPVVVAAVQTDEKDKAFALLQSRKVNADSYKYMNGYVFFVDEDTANSKFATVFDTIQSVIDHKTKSLQDRASYKADLKLLHGEHVVLGWVDLPGLTKIGVDAAKKDYSAQSSGSATSTGSSSAVAYGSKTKAVKASFTSATVQAQSADPYADDSYLSDSSADDSFGGSSSTSSGTDPYSSALNPFQSLLGLANGDSVDKSLDKVQSKVDAVGALVFELYATSDGLSFEAVTEHSSTSKKSGSDHKLLNSLPADSDVAFDVGDFGDMVVGALKSSGSSSQSTSAEAADASDFAKALGSEAAGVFNYKPDTAGKYQVAMVSTLQDQAAALRIVQKYAQQSVDAGQAAEFAVSGGKGWGTVTDDSSTYGAYLSTTKVSIAIANNRIAVSNDRALTKALLSDDGKFGQSDAVQKALKNGDELTSLEAFANIQSIIDKVEKSDPSALKSTDESTKWAESLGSYGYKAYDDGEHLRFNMELTLTN